MKKEQITALQAILRVMEMPAAKEKRVLDIVEGVNHAEPEVWLPTRAAAQLIGAHPQTLFRYRRRGLIRSIWRSQRCIRWSKQDLMRLNSEGINHA